MANETGIGVTVDRVEEFLKSINELTRQQVLVGIPQSTSGRSGSPIDNAALGYIHENGSPAKNIPARPFLYPTVNRLQDQAVGMLKKAAELSLDNKPAQAQNTLEALGMMAATAVKNAIVAGEGFQPLADATIAARQRRGNMSTKPLIDTAQLLGAISYVVRCK